MATKEEKKKKEKIRREYYMTLFDIEKQCLLTAISDAGCDFRLYKAKDGSYIFGKIQKNEDGSTKLVKKKDAFTFLKQNLNDKTLRKMGSRKAIKAYINLIDENAKGKDDYYIDTIPICNRLFPVIEEPAPENQAGEESEKEKMP